MPAMHYRVTAQFPAGPVTSGWDGTHAQRYFPWLGEVEVYRPEPETPDQYWWNDLNDGTLPGLLRPAQFDYNLAGPTTVDGRAAVALVLPGGTGVVPGRAPTLVDLDAATSLPLRLVTDTGVPAPDAPGTLRLERTFADVRVNAPVPAADLAIPLAPDTLAVEHPGFMADSLAVYGTAAEAARAAGVPLYAPAGGATGPFAAPVFVTRAGRRTAVIALDAAGLLEGAALPALGTTYPPAPPAPATPLTIAGHPATLQGGILRVTLGTTQVQIPNVPDAAAAAAAVAALTPVP